MKSAAVQLSVPAPSAPRFSDAATWLLAGPAQLRDGPHTGAVAGCLDDQGLAAYLYPEITGYYLQWLAWRARQHGAAPAERAAALAAQRWLAYWLCLSDPPLTRVGIAGVDTDWRNDAVFCFDLAMVLRGLAEAAKAGLLEPEPTIVGGLARQLERLVAADGLFVACVPTLAGATLPQRWSTRRGSFLAKAAAGIMTASHSLPGIGAQIACAAEATYAASLRWFADTPHDELHPLLYACEGILSLPRHPSFATTLPAMRHYVAEMLHLAQADGALPEARSQRERGPARTDVLAQLLRVAALLCVRDPKDRPDQVALARLRHALGRRMQPDGAFAFGLDVATSARNVWATMFSDQALAFAATPGLAAAARDDDPLLV
jgi:hypothetical protein